MPIYMGSTKVENLHIGGTKVGEGWIWNGTEWVQVYSSVPPFTPAGMNKNGTFSIPSRNTRTHVTGWVPRPGFPDTVIDSNCLRMAGSGTVEATAFIEFQGSGASSRELWIVRNGVDVAHSPLGSVQSGSAVGTFEVQDGDLVWMEASTSSTALQRGNVLPSSYLVVEKFDA